MPRIRVTDAAKLADASYRRGGIKSPKTLHSCGETDVEAYFLKGNILVLPGSNSFADYTRFNLRMINFGGQQLRIGDAHHTRGTGGIVWHQGFLTYAYIVQNWLKACGKTPELIIGHSLGAAAAQILCRSYGVPTIAFAAPRPKWVRGHVKHEKKLLILNRHDDPISRIPIGYSHMGELRILKGKKRHWPGHNMKHYRTALDEVSNYPKYWG